jgi:hypothetical protein
MLLSILHRYGSSFCRFCPSILLAASRDCKACTSVAVYGRILSSFLAMAADNFEMPVSCAGALVIYELCVLNLPLFFFRFIVGKQSAFSGRFLVQKRPSGPDILNNFMDSSSAWNCVPGIFMTKFSPRHFLAEPHFTYGSYRKLRCSTVHRTVFTDNSTSQDATVLLYVNNSSSTCP